jgi:hypothetical protein
MSSVCQTERGRFLFQLENVPTNRALSIGCEVEGSAGVSSCLSASSIPVYLVRSSLLPGLYILETLRLLIRRPLDMLFHNLSYSDQLYFDRHLLRSNYFSSSSLS